MIDTVRYYLALILLVTVPPALVFWFLAHGFVAGWRRRHPAVTYGALFGTMAVVGLALWWVRRPLLAVDLGWSPWLLLPAVVVYGASIAVESACRKHLKVRTLIGVPELVDGVEGPGLLQQGIYARVRHPRYLAVILALLGFAFFVNYLAAWALLALFVVGIYLVILMEESELVDRFGEAYLDYQRRVPRLWPRG